ncbi:MAG: hypothetical protein ACREID_07160, partial [Planctomycetota bacterium]
MNDGVNLLELLREARRSASDRRKVFLALYGLLVFVPLVLLVVAAGRAALLGGFEAQAREVFLRPVHSTLTFFSDAFGEGRWGLMTLVALGAWIAAALVGSFFGLAVTRMAAVELSCGRRAEVKEALRFARSHWWWAFLTPVSLLAAAVALILLGTGLVSVARAGDLLLVAAAPVAFVLALGAAFLLL